MLRSMAAGFGKECGDLGRRRFEYCKWIGVLSTEGASSLRSVVNSSSEKRSRQAALSMGCVRIVVDAEVDGDAGVDGDEFFREENVVAVIL